MVRSRPLHGESIYLRICLWMQCWLRMLFSSPPRGIYISTGKAALFAISRIVLVPSTGNLYIYRLTVFGHFKKVRSRPLHGKSIYLRICLWMQCWLRMLFSSPPRGIYISTFRKSRRGSRTLSSRPLHGESIYLRNKHKGERIMKFSSRPLHGESIYLHVWDYIQAIEILKFSSPPRGIYISTK